MRSAVRFPFPVQQVAFRPLAHLERKREVPTAVGHVRIEPREPGALSHHLIQRGAAERLQRREQLDAFHHVRLPHGVRAHEHGQRAQARQLEGLVVPEVAKRYAFDAQVHGAKGRGGAPRRCAPA